jgi:hypothetical protein
MGGLMMLPRNLSFPSAKGWENNGTARMKKQQTDKNNDVDELQK